MSWHLTVATIDAYLVGRVSDACAASTETHLMRCADCRALLADREHQDVAARRRHNDGLDRILDRIDQPRRGVFERLLVTVGVSASLARLTAGAPRLRHAWFAAGLSVLVVAVLLAQFSSGPVGAVLFVVTAPVAPVIGIALTYGRRADPAGEVGVVVPFPAFRLLLLRSVIVLASWLPPAALLAAALPDHGAVPLLWFVPALALTSLTVALSGYVGTVPAAAAVATGWLVVAAATVRGNRGSPAAVWLDHSQLFRPAGQVLLALLAVTATFVAVARRAAYDARETA
ncbi:hypothetical protein M1L60_09215 [Actinoplanes sp. TRM 88003]|uniref:Zinc-finger domain-containing protein n=1 Tax=Paractinoplanes aksuensis TaxID=2939490 RepID=A0ABT1DIW4_9ACTN|nr:hypothetical protein [Actinoplanes aksuensis]MCO8270773.1 hypothetical protein [Actinoplanes aksuensis]